jgi:hypothetical protein
LGEIPPEKNISKNNLKGDKGCVRMEGNPWKLSLKGNGPHDLSSPSQSKADSKLYRESSLVKRTAWELYHNTIGCF